MPKYVNLRDVPARVQQRREFKMSRSLTGTNYRTIRGWLPIEWHERFEQATTATDFYVVHSYNTPIAWHANGAWVVPGEKYSRTTTRHQNITIRELDPAICQVVGV